MGVRVRGYVYSTFTVKMITNILSVIVFVSSFIYTCYTLCNLTYFLSSYYDKRDVLSDDNAKQSILWALFLDILLLSGFIFQHSVISHLLKNTFCRLHMEHLERSIYNVYSSGALHILINKWQPTPTVSLWNLDTSNNTVWMIFSSFHVFAWSIIYSGCIMMDIAELCGLKQVFYRISGRSNPLDNKSKELKRYMKHMRHPSFTGFLIILWIYPFMSLDRLLLAIVLMVYMAIRWTIDPEDYSYHVRNFRRKRIELS